MLCKFKISNEPNAHGNFSPYCIVINNSPSFSGIVMLSFFPVY